MSRLHSMPLQRTWLTKIPGTESKSAQSSCLRLVLEPSRASWASAAEPGPVDGGWPGCAGTAGFGNWVFISHSESLGAGFTCGHLNVSVLTQS